MPTYRGVSSALGIAVALAGFCFQAPADEFDPTLLTHADDYVFGYYPHGWRGLGSDGRNDFAIQTNGYALVLDATSARVSQLGALHKGRPGTDGLMEDNGLLEGLPATSLRFYVETSGQTYGRVTAAPSRDDVLIQRLGKYLAHIEVRHVTFHDSEGRALSDVQGTLHLYAWPDRVSFRLNLAANDSSGPMTIGCYFETDNTGGQRFAIENPYPSEQRIELVSSSRVRVARLRPPTAAGASSSVAVTLVPARTRIGSRKLDLHEPPDACAVSAEAIGPYAGPLDVESDPVSGLQRVLLGKNGDIRAMERVHVRLENPTERARTLRLAFSKAGGGFGITGMSPVLCDTNGLPLGLPVQLSKNWHCNPPWFDGITMLELPARSTTELEFRLAYANWGRLPAVAHAQLALEGWGTHQLWDQLAIGSFGESICYDPDVNLNRSMIDDVRPLMVWGMGADAHKKWSWTHNVGGGDFLVLFQNGERQYLSRQKTLYESYGPILTDVTYGGETPDGAIQSRIRTQTWRSADFVRGVYTLRYDVKMPVTGVERLAFFQLGADHYNHNLFSTITRGNLDGAMETWMPEMGGKRYSRACLPLEGDMAWLALTGATKNPPPYVKEGDKGAWANRGLIVRSWRARLGGKDVPLPHFSIYGTEDGNVPSAIAELSPPPDFGDLRKGDYVEAVVEMVIIPQRAEDYYGPDDELRRVLQDHPDDWHLIHREALAGDLDVTATKGRVEQTWPPIIRATHGTEAEFTIEGDLGYTPITITGLKTYGPFRVDLIGDGQPHQIDDSSANGNDWWQARRNQFGSTWALTFTKPYLVAHRELRFRFNTFGD